MNESIADIVHILCDGGVGVMPTDTILGIVARAHDQKAVERVYTIKKRVQTQPFLVLINHIDDIADFDVKLTECQKKILNDLWHGASNCYAHVMTSRDNRKYDRLRPVSVIVPSPGESYAYIHRRRYSLGFRLVKEDSESEHCVNLRRIMQKTGPLIATSANLSGEPFAQTIDHARDYFGDMCDFYLKQSHDLQKHPSMILVLQGETLSLVRA